MPARADSGAPAHRREVIRAHGAKRAAVASDEGRTALTIRLTYGPVQVPGHAPIVGCTPMRVPRLTVLDGPSGMRGSRRVPSVDRTARPRTTMSTSAPDPGATDIGRPLRCDAVMASRSPRRAVSASRGPRWKRLARTARRPVSRRTARASAGPGARQFALLIHPVRADRGAPSSSRSPSTRCWASTVPPRTAPTPRPSPATCRAPTASILQQIE